jgi:HEPN domain-containing protein
MKERPRNLTLEWLDRAESDLKYAEASLLEFDDFYSQICILCHDATEKYLKAYLVHRGVNPGRIHDLPALLKECIATSEDASDVKSCESGCRTLNRYYTPLKYPSLYPTPNRSQAREAVDIATEISHIIKRRIGTDHD